MLTIHASTLEVYTFAAVAPFLAGIAHMLGQRTAERVLRQARTITVRRSEGTVIIETADRLTDAEGAVIARAAKSLRDADQ